MSVTDRVGVASVTSGTRTADILLRGIGRVGIEWDHVAETEHVACHSVKLKSGVAMVVGHIIGANESEMRVSGCGYEEDVDALGEFAMEILAESCDLRLVTSRQGVRFEGPPVQVSATLGEEVYVALLVPPSAAPSPTKLRELRDRYSRVQQACSGPQSSPLREEKCSNWLDKLEEELAYWEND